VKPDISGVDFDAADAVVGRSPTCVIAADFADKEPLVAFDMLIIFLAPQHSLSALSVWKSTPRDML